MASKMDDASRLQIHDNLHRQINSYEKLLRHTGSKFDIQKHHEMIQLVSRGLPKNFTPRQKLNKSRAKFDIQTIDSIIKLKEVVDEFKTGQRKGILKEEERHAIQYFADFFNELESLKALKGYFDDRIYITLQEYFYDSAQSDDIAEDDDISVIEDVSPISSEDVINNKADKVKAFLPWVDDNDGNHNIENNAIKSKDKSKIQINACVRKLRKINSKWDKLFTDVTIDAQNFENESKQNISHLNNYNIHENILRLVPDLLIKSEESIELAKKWWIHANKFYDILPKDAYKQKVKQINQLEEMLETLKSEIDTHEEAKTLLVEDVNVLEKRNKRVQTLQEQLENVEEMRNFVLKMYRTITNEKLRIQLNIVEDDLEGKDRDVLISQSLAYEVRLMKLDKELSVLDFQHSLVMSDYQLELEIHPEMVRYLGAQRIETEDMKAVIKEKREEKKDMEKQLEILKDEVHKIESGEKRNQLESKSPGLVLRSNTFTTEKSIVKKDSPANEHRWELNTDSNENGLHNDPRTDSRLNPKSGNNAETEIELSDEEF
ncbi:unnamed protein product [Owenia fusiformis]|nr:unnamed protein product [Owenia fusiformis]